MMWSKIAQKKSKQKVIKAQRNIQEVISLKKSIIFSIVFALIILNAAACSNYSDEDQNTFSAEKDVKLEELYDNHSDKNHEIAEKYVRYYYIMEKAKYCLVEKIIYDAKTDRYIVHLKDEDNTAKMFIVGITGGEVSSYDACDGAGELPVLPLTDQKIAEQHAVGYYRGKEFQLYYVEETIYDAKTDRYIVHLKEDEGNTTRILTVTVTDGKVSRSDER